MTEDFALVDFALTARSPVEVAEAIGRLRTPSAGAGSGAAGGWFGHALVSRILSRFPQTGTRPAAAPDLTLQPEGTLPPPPLVREILTEPGSSGSRGPVRLSGPLGVAGLTLIEFRESDGDTSAFCEALSAELRGDEVFFFRHSGSRHPGAHYAFHVYQDGRAIRRAVSASRDGTMPEAEWTGIDDGILHPLETDSLAPPGAPKSEIMTPVRQAAILESLGIDPEMLFDPLGHPAETVLELSTDSGGLPLSALRTSGEKGLPTFRRSGLGAAAVAAPEIDIDDDIASPPPEPAPTPESDATPRPKPDTAVSASRSSGLWPWDENQPAESRAEPPAAPADPAPTWEEEVTNILLVAAESALPPQEQVAWLDRLTARLEKGEIDSALAEASEMILAGDRDDAEKAAAASRLAALFGRDA